MKNLNFILFLFFVFYNNAFTQNCLSDGITFSSQAEIDDFPNNYPGCTEILGTVEIDSSSNITNLNGLNSVTRIEGSLIIENVNTLTNLTGLENLNSVLSLSLRENDALINLSGLSNLDSAAQVFLINNISLTDISSLNNLNYLHYHLLIKNCNALTSLNGLENINPFIKRIYIQENNMLSDISSLSNLNSVEDFIITENNLLENLDGLQNIDSIHKELRLVNNPSLNNLNHLNSLTYVGTIFTISESPLLENLSDLESLDNVGGRLSVTKNHGLIDLTGLENLTTIGEFLWIDENFELINIEALGSLNYVGENILIGNSAIGNGLPSLTSLKGLENITSLSERLSINQCNSLTNLEGLENLKFIGQGLSIRGNESLENLWGLHNLDTLGGSIRISGNDTLNHIGAIRDAYFWNVSLLNIGYNQNLEICNEINICNYLLNGGNAQISNNATGCKTEDEILDACSFTFSKLETFAFYDENQNKIQDSNELILPDVRFDLEPDGFSFFSNPYGSTTTYLDSGNHVVQYEVNSVPNWNLTTDSSSFSFLIDQSNECDSVHFGFYPNEQISNVQTHITGEPARCGEFITLKVHAKNLGTTVASGTLWLLKDGYIDSLEYIDIPDTTVNTALYGWHFENLYPGYTFDVSINILVPAPPDISIGDSLYFNSFVEYLPLIGDETQFTFNYPTEIRCSFDPNDKQVSPSRINKYTYFDENINYTIRFQNTGNAEAYDIIIRDTLDENLDPSTFKILSTSHPNVLTTTMESDQFLTFNFENIYLPDSSSNFDASQGYVSYMIKSKEGLTPETLIENKASIYFDSNPPIVTNTTTSIMVPRFYTNIKDLREEGKIKVQMYPNPVSDNVFIKKENSDKLEYQITDVNGSVLMNGELIDEVHNITFTEMNSGIYFVKIINTEAREYIVRKIVVL